MTATDFKVLFKRFVLIQVLNYVHCVRGIHFHSLDVTHIHTPTATIFTADASDFSMRLYFALMQVALCKRGCMERYQNTTVSADDCSTTCVSETFTFSIYTMS